jgi:tetratricopeptide (TPR) repeat protein
MRALKILAAVYETTWDRLVDVNDLEVMPAHERQEFLEIGRRRGGNSPDLLVSRQYRRRPGAAPSGADLPFGRPGGGGKSATVAEPLTITAPERSSARSGSALPGKITHFTGRDGPMAELRTRITEHAPQGTVVTIYAIDGMAGVGKTAFARHAAQEFAERYPDGAIWVDLYGHTPGMQAREPSGALEQLLLQIGVPPEAIKPNLVERQDQWRYHIHAQRKLIVLDNALTSDQVLPLLPEAPGCLVLITSRRKLTGLTDAYPLSLDVLGWDEAERLFIKLVGEHRCSDRDAVRQILAVCGRLPLAIRLIAGRLRHHRYELLADVAADFADQSAALDAFVAEHVSVRAAFEWSYRLLTDVQQRAFRLLGWHPGPETTPVVIAAVADVSLAQGRQLLRELVDHNLLDQLSAAGGPGGPRYRMHDLVRLYARERADAEEPPTERAAVVDRLAGSYLAIMWKVDRLLRPYLSDGPGENTARGPILPLADGSQARSWLTVERHNLLGCVRAMSPTTDAAELSMLLAAHFHDFGFWSDARDLYRQALTAFRHLGDQRGEVDGLCGLGEVEWLVGEYGQARDYYSQALFLAGSLGYRRGEVDALCGLGYVEWLVGECVQAREYYTQALFMARELGYRRGEVDALWGLGDVERVAGEYVRAQDYHSQMLVLARQLGYRRAEVDALRGLGQVERFINECGQAREFHTQALALARQLGYQRIEVDALWGLGEVERLVGECDRARELHTQALALARQLGYRRGEAEALRELGEVERFVGVYGQAQGFYKEALALARQRGYRRVEIDALRGLGEVERFIGGYGQAREYCTQVLSLARHLGYRRGEADGLRGLGRVQRLVGEYGQAREYYTQGLFLARQLGYRRGEAEALRALGEMERLAGACGQAREYFNQAMALESHFGYRFGVVLALCGLGRVAQASGECGQAREYHSSALALARQLGYRFGEVLALCGLGEVEGLAGEDEQACRYYTHALTLARELGDRRAEADVLWAMGHLSGGADCDRSGSLRRDARKIYEELGVPVAGIARAGCADSIVDPPAS